MINISTIAGNQPDVKVRFTWNGRYYYWLIDDVQIVETPKHNIALGDFFYPAASYAQPVTLIDTDTMAFLVVKRLLPKIKVREDLGKLIFS